MIEKVGLKKLKEVMWITKLLWPHHSEIELENEFKKILSDKNAGVFLKTEDGEIVGFAQCSLRKDYVEGTSSLPVGYLEGIFVTEKFRGKGVAKELLSCCENWAREKGCKEFASDCEIENTLSIAFHKSVNFKEVNRIVCFVKKI